MKVNLNESLYGLGGLFHILGHEMDCIEEEIQDEETPDLERIQVSIDIIMREFKAITIGEKYIPLGLLIDYIHAIKRVEMYASYKNLDVIKTADYERQYRHLTILEFAQEERKSDWDDIMNEWIANKIKEDYL